MSNRNFQKVQKERKRQEKAAAKREQRQQKNRAGKTAGAGPPIDYDARVVIPTDDLEVEEGPGR